jgi:CO dehydrogenase maturation factor
VKLAFAGKGGSGKSTVVGTIARLLARNGQRTLVLDSDVMPGIAGAIGLVATDAPIPDEAVEEDPEGDGRRFRLRAGLSAEEAVERYALRGPDDVRLLQVGKLRLEGPWTLVASRQACGQIARELSGDRWHVIGDLPGGTRQPFLGWGAYAQTMVAVVEPTVKSFMTARRLRRLARVPDGPTLLVLANKVGSRSDVGRIEEETGLPVVGAVPYDEAVRDADRAGVALVDHAPDSAATASISSFVASLRERDATPEGSA